MHTIKLLVTYYLNISVQAANLLDCRIESNRKNRFGSENRIETFFGPNWNALIGSLFYTVIGRILCVQSRSVARSVGLSICLLVCL